MFAFGFRSRAQHPLVRLLALVLGTVVLLVVLAFGFFAAVALAVGGAVFVLLNALRTPRPAAPAGQAAQAPTGAIEGEFKVVRETQARH